MLVLLPLLGYLSCFILLKTHQRGDDWRKGVLRAGVIWGVYAVLTLELLSIFKAITPIGLAIFWILPIFIIIGWLARGLKRQGRLSLVRWPFKEDWVSTVLLLGVLIIVLVTAVVAWKTPPQTWDSLNYHMSRVAHWAQQSAVRHYPTGIEVQNNMPPGAEFLVLHTYVLSQGDIWVNFIQWFAMVGSLIGVSWIAQQLGATWRGQLLSVVFAATLPMGIVQASSTMTDYVLSFWMVCVATEAIQIWKGKSGRREIILVSLAAGLAILTKPTAYAYLLPFALWVLWSLLRTSRPWRVVGMGVLAIMLVLLVVGGHFTRNQLLYSNPISPPNRIDEHANQLLSPRGLLSNLVRNASLHIRTPLPHVNKAFALGIQWIHDGIGLDENDPRTTSAGKFKISQPSTHEILTGNPLHALLIALLILILMWQRRSYDRNLIIYAAVVLTTYVLLSLFYKWQIFGSRYQLPFFILCTPLVGVMLADKASKKIGSCVGILLILASLPWLLSIETRPILPIEGRSPVDSVLTESRLNLLFSTGSYLIEPVRDMVVRIEEAGCTSVGLVLAGNGAEYPFWYMLEAPRQDLRLEWIVTGTYSEKLSDPDFSPCAVICENCQIPSDVFRGLPQVIERAPYRLYLSHPD